MELIALCMIVQSKEILQESKMSREIELNFMMKQIMTYPTGQNQLLLWLRKRVSSRVIQLWKR